MNIKKVSDLTGVSADTIRYYERIGLLPPITRNENGIRDFGEKEIGWIEFTKHFRATGMSIEKLAEYIALFQQGDATIPARIEILEEERDRLLEQRDALQANLDKLNYKIENYRNVIIPIENSLKNKGASEHDEL